MAVDEASRFALHERARDAFGDEAAATMMELLPPVGWGDVARTRDLDALEERLGGRIDALDQRLNGRIDALDQRLNGQIDVLDQHLGGRIDALDQRINGRIDALEQHLGGRIDALGTQVNGFEERFDLKLEALEHRLLSALHSGLAAQTRALIATSTATAVGFGGLLLAAVRLGGG